MDDTAQIGYGFSEESLREFETEFKLDSLARMWEGWKTTALIKKGVSEAWRILESQKRLSEETLKLPDNPEIQMAFIRRAEPILLVKIDERDLDKQDFTFYLKRNPAKDDVEDLLQRHLKNDKPRTSYERKLRIFSKENQWFCEGRVLACLCSKGESWSLTLRKERDSLGKDLSPGFLNKEEQINSLLADLIFGKKAANKRGLLVISGRTGVAKSKVARGLIKSYMTMSVEHSPHRTPHPPHRTPHLLTYEDPIEDYIYDLDGEEENYTPRQRGFDVNDINQAVNDALRQTPTILFVGETRDPRDWKQLLHFAGTGHLVITTMHAGSLTEAMGNIMEAAEAKEPSARSIIADRLLAVIHLRAGEALETPFVLPALWLRTPIGSKTLMADGLSSLLPNTPKPLKDFQMDNDPLPSSISRYWFARELVDRAKTGNEQKDEKVKSKGVEWDLEGL